ncbi:nodulation protein NodN [Novosphingobium sp. PC22D]|uniref:MaoC family dehydratase n=1 Tax=Novosphingobium sp. PC22D TaxID=1962403 RepID=UPI000BF1EDA4|nr:MaoC family dehydratase [Novosphingobium sp. PC22D]PEQ13738.1 nodulation protein NodN [Novosphingobium sp. PC22D]
MKEDIVQAQAQFVREQVGRTYLSDWMLVDQALIDRFAETTDDHAFIHVEPEAAREAGFDGTIAHGFLTLSLLAPMRGQISRPVFPGLRSGYNYGLDGVRFLAPVAAGKRIRGRMTVASIEERQPGRFREALDVVVEIEGEDTPALVATWITLHVT